MLMCVTVNMLHELFVFVKLLFTPSLRAVFFERKLELNSEKSKLM